MTEHTWVSIALRHARFHAVLTQRFKELRVAAASDTWRLTKPAAVAAAKLCARAARHDQRMQRHLDRYARAAGSVQ